jgi:flagellar hook-length control protein FliK
VAGVSVVASLFAPPIGSASPVPGSGAPAAGASERAAARPAERSDRFERAVERLGDRSPERIGFSTGIGVSTGTGTGVSTGIGVSASPGSDPGERLRDARGDSADTVSALAAAHGLNRIEAAVQATYAAAAEAAPASIVVHDPIDSPGFAPSLAAQVSVLARDGIDRAEIRLNPAEMGPVSVQIQMDGTQARVEFMADVAATRAALEASVPQLASALREAGLTLSGGGVFQQPPGDRPAARQGQDGSGRGRPGSGSRGDGTAAVASVGSPGTAGIERLRGLTGPDGRVDLYA